MSTQYIGRQPILDKEGKTFAYELFLNSENKDNRFFSVAILVKVLNKFGARKILGKHRAFLKVDNTFLLHDMIFNIPKNIFIFSLTENVKVTPLLIERLALLRKKGYLLAIDNMKGSEGCLLKLHDILRYLTFCKIDVSELANIDEPFIEILKKHKLRIIADNVSEHSEHKAFEALGCDYFQGFFFAKPKIFETQSFNPRQLSIINLTNLLMTECSIDELTSAFENNYEISLQLLQFINSGAFHFKEKIASLHHVLMLMGRTPLLQWLQLMIYAKSADKTITTSPLMLMVKYRSELMMALIKVVDPDARSNTLGKAYFVGVLSLIDTLFSMPLETILEDLNISDDVVVALTDHIGILGELYHFVLETEKFNTEAIADFAIKYNLGIHEMEAILVETATKVNELDEKLRG